MHIGITGISGFIGHHIANLLIQNGHTIRGFVHKKAPPPLEGLEIVKGGMLNPETLSAFTDGLDCIIHCAAVTSGTEQMFHNINVAGTENLIKAAENSDVGRFLFISSMAAREAQLSPYAKSKSDAEALFQKSTLRYDIVRPPAVYGPGDHAMLPLFKLLRKGIGLRVGKKTSRFALLYVDDMAQAALKWVQSAKTTQKAYELGDFKHNGYSWEEFMRLGGEAMEKKIILIPVPELLTLFIGFFTEHGADLMNKTTFLTLGKTKELCHKDWLCHDRSFETTFDWAAETNPLDALRETIQWYKNKNLL